MTKFNVNEYDLVALQVEFESPELGSQTDDSQAQSVRDILNRYAITGQVVGRDPSRDSFIGKIEEDEDIRSENVNNMLDTPDLSMMDEMEIKDYIRDNISLSDDGENPEAAPPDSDAASSHGDDSPPSSIDDSK